MSLLKNLASIPLAIVFLLIAVPAYIVTTIIGTFMVLVKWIRDWG